MKVYVSFYSVLSEINKTGGHTTESCLPLITITSSTGVDYTRAKLLQAHDAILLLKLILYRPPFITVLFDCRTSSVHGLFQNIKCSAIGYPWTKITKVVAHLRGYQIYFEGKDMLKDKNVDLILFYSV